LCGGSFSERQLVADRCGILFSPQIIGELAMFSFLKQGLVADRQYDSAAKK